MKPYLLLLFVTLFFLSGCLKFNHDDVSKVPTTPSNNTFKLEIKGLTDINIASQHSISNWYRAYSSVLYWKYLISSNISLQYNLLDSANKYQVEYFADNTWIRKNSLIYDSSNFEVFLYSTIEADSSILWEMFLSENQNNTYLVLQGYTSKNKKQGNWYFYKYVFKPISVLKVDWLYTDTSLRIIYSNIYEISDKFGSNLLVEYLSDPSKNSSYNILINLNNSDFTATTKIEIDSTTKQGRIYDSIYFNDTLWHYWNSNFENIP
ncbi:MAG: hypothetical protein JXR68_11475 [Bacteroidales bacterium]|nr:hypothetical protein [Bacteroidales bacterium]